MVEMGVEEMAAVETRCSESVMKMTIGVWHWVPSGDLGQRLRDYKYWMGKDGRKRHGVQMVLAAREILQLGGGD